MAESEWEELENLSRHIGRARVPLHAAKARRMFDMARVLEQEIAEMERRHGELLATIAGRVVAEQGDFKGVSHADGAVAPDRNNGCGDTELGTQRDRVETATWKQTAQADVERARQELERRRTEMLARHTAELKSLEAEVLEQAISAFVREFGSAACGVRYPQLSEDDARNG